MKKVFSLIVFSVLFSAGILFGQDNHFNQISVTGKAEIVVPADRAVFSFSVTGYGSNLRTAVEKAKNKIKDITGKLINLGLKEENLAISNFYSSENFEGKAFLSSSKDFKTSISVTVTINDLKLLEESILILSESSIENITNITFKLKNFESAKEKARLQAIEDARYKATQIAEKLNVKLGTIRNCEEIETGFGYTPNPFNSSQEINQMAGAGTSGFYAKSISVSWGLRLVYEIAK